MGRHGVSGWEREKKSWGGGIGRGTVREKKRVRGRERQREIG